jgi:hypothetical protein
MFEQEKCMQNYFYVRDKRATYSRHLMCVRICAGCFDD